MMPHFKTIALLIILLLSACATSYRSETDSTTTSAEFADYPELPGDTLSTEELTNFETLAIQKFMELMDYLALAKESTYDTLVRNQALKAANQMMITEPDLGNSLDTIIIVDLSGVPLISEKNEGKILESFTDSFEGSFHGVIQYATELGEWQVNCYLIRLTKSFGREKQSVWEIRFGDFNPAKI